MWLIFFGFLYFLAARIYYPISLLINRYFHDILTCHFLQYTGFECPTCGGSRAAYYFVTGDWSLSIFHSFPTFVMSLYILGLWLYGCFALLEKRKVTIHTRFHKLTWTVLALLFLVFWGVKIVYR